jgi:hypothetical protein
MNLNLEKGTQLITKLKKDYKNHWRVDSFSFIGKQI